MFEIYNICNCDRCKLQKEKEMKQDQYIIVRDPRDNSERSNAPRRIYDNFSAAKSESERLAASNVGMKFYIARLVAISESIPNPLVSTQLL